MEKLEKFIIKNISTSLIVVCCIVGILLIRGCSKQNKIESLQNKIEVNNSIAKLQYDSLAKIIEIQNKDITNLSNQLIKADKDNLYLKNLNEEQAKKSTIVNNNTTIRTHQPIRKDTLK